MRFAILGAGAIGAYLGAALARGGADVVLIARGAQLEALQRDGVRVLSPRGDFEAKPPATDDLAAVAGADVVVIALKAYSIPALAPRLGELLDARPAVLPAQNGVPVVVLPVVRRRARGHGRRERRSRTASISRAIEPRARDRLRPLPGDGARRAGRRPPHRGHALHDRRARRLGERALPPRSPRRSRPAA